jgi:hypothetical protein
VQGYGIPTLEELSESVLKCRSVREIRCSTKVLEPAQACVCSMSNTGLRAVGGVAKKGAKKAAAGFSGALLGELSRGDQGPALPTSLQQ